MFKREKGITLVALVITIIILIILAAVTITTVMKSDLFNLAKSAADNYIEAGKKEDAAFQEFADNIAKLEQAIRELQGEE